MHTRRTARFWNQVDRFEYRWTPPIPILPANCTDNIVALISFIAPLIAINVYCFRNLTHNLFTGQVPDSWQNLPNLAILDLSYNLLNGSAPSWLPHIPGANASFNCFVASPDAASQLNPSCNASSSPSIASASLPAFTVPTQSDKLNDRGIAIVASLTGAAALFGIILACIVCRRRALYANWKGDVRARNADALEATRDAFKEASVVVAVPAREPRIAAGSASPPLMPQRFAMSTGEVRPGYPRAGVSAGAAWLPEREGSFDSVRVRDEDRKRDEWMRQRMVR
ncbi:hypothetical protein BC830DRAFT_1117044 [Chytriomyces sp. MP71]|nr:hypothetical protein BC830DRAFT_1117044 [Chytriomyces sp. MP71]